MSAQQDVLIDRPCPMCGSTDPSIIFADSIFDPSKMDAMSYASRKLPEYMHHRLVLCPTCELVYSSPVPKLDSIEEGYEQASFDASEESVCAAKTYAGYLKPVLRRLPSLDSCMDIGAGDGTMVAEMVRLGFAKVIGIEPSEAPIQKADPSIAPMLRKAFFSGDDYEAGSFDLITCFQTIEHVPEPAGLARDAMRLLKPGGALVIVCHNLNAVSAKILKRKSPIFDIEHLQLFSTTSISGLYRRAGFVDIAAFGIVNRYPIRYYTRLMPLPKALKAATLKHMENSALGRIMIPLPLGNLFVVGFRPNVMKND